MFQSLGRDSGRSDQQIHEQYHLYRNSFNRSGAIRVALTLHPACIVCVLQQFQSLGRDSGRSDTVLRHLSFWTCHRFQSLGRDSGRSDGHVPVCERAFVSVSIARARFGSL